MHNSKPILLVEDDRIDALTVKRALKDLKVINELVHVVNGEEALDYLRNGSNEKPCVILSDLNMPGMGGKEFLRRIKADEKLDTIPVVILTNSDSKEDFIDSYKLHASCYIKKPVTRQGFQEVMLKLGEYWLTICKRVSESELQCTRN